MEFLLRTSVRDGREGTLGKRESKPFPGIRDTKQTVTESPAGNSTATNLKGASSAQMAVLIRLNPEHHSLVMSLT